VRKDGQAARTQIQLATKNSPSLVERYFIYVSQDVAKKLKSECERQRLLLALAYVADPAQQQ
jgi:hypothetical protein